MSTDEITPGERRELRSIVKGQFKVLRAEVKRRQQEMVAEVEQEILNRYREQDVAIAEAQEEARREVDDCVRRVIEIGQRLQAAHPTLVVKAGQSRYSGDIRLDADDPNRSQLHRAAIAAIPDKIGDANLALDRQEMNLLRDLSAGALSSEAARKFLDSIPSVGELVPRTRLREIESSLNIGGEQ